MLVVIKHAATIAIIMATTLIENFVANDLLFLSMPFSPIIFKFGLSHFFSFYKPLDYITI